MGIFSIVIKILNNKSILCLNRSDESSQKNEFEEQSIITEALLIGHDAPFKKCFKPEFIRLAPPLHICQDEVISFERLHYYLDFF